MPQDQKTGWDDATGAPGVLAFRRAQGYRLVRLGISGGRRAGEPAAVMIRPGCAEAAALAETLRFQVRELERALESFRRVMDMIERDPGALLRGKAPSSPGGGNR